MASSSDADIRTRASIARALARGLAWSRINEVLAEDREDAGAVPDLLNQLEPERHDEASDESATSPSLDEKRDAWLRLNRVFK